MDTSTLRGHVSRVINLRTNDPNLPFTRLTMNVIVRTSVDVLPQIQVQLSNAREGTQQARVLLRREPDEKGQLAVTGLRASASWLEARASKIETTRPGGGGIPTGRPGDWLIEVALAEQPPRGETHAELSFKTGLTLEPEITLPVTVRYVPVVRLNFNEAVLTANAGSSPSDTVIGAVRRGLDSGQLRVTVEPSSMRARIEPSGKRHFKLHLEWPGAGGGDTGTVTFHMGDETFALPVSIVASGR